jgi:hypothetical protein
MIPSGIAAAKGQLAPAPQTIALMPVTARPMISF